MVATLKNNTEQIKLNTGVSIPAIGLGTWRSTEADDGYTSVKTALQLGYRHIDTAAIYQNEDQVGKGIADSGVPRDEIFVTTKLWCTQLHSPEVALESSLKRLGLDYVDLYLMHWPVSLNPRSIKDGNFLTIPIKPDGSRDVEIDTWDFIRAWELMQKLPKSKARAIGISNFSINNIKDLLASPGNNIVPAINQVELHPLLPQPELIEFCNKKGIVIEAYSPLGSQDAPILTEPVIIEMAKKYGAQPAQVVISWHLQRGYVVLPKSVHTERIAANFQTFILEQEDFESLNNLSKVRGERRVGHPDWAPFVPFV